MGSHITYDSMDGQYIIHKNDEDIQLNKDKMGLPYIDAKTPQDVDFVQTVWENFDGFTKKEITATKLTREDQEMIGHI